MNETTWEVTAEQFVDAVRRDEYAELRLSTGDVLITDWEGDGTFYPYVEIADGRCRPPCDDVLEDVACAIENVLATRVTGIEYDSRNDVLVPYMHRPTETR